MDVGVKYTGSNAKYVPTTQDARSSDEAGWSTVGSSKKSVISYAIACFSVREDGIQRLLMVERNGSYQHASLFSHWHGNIKINQHFFNRMTLKEQASCLDPNFDFRAAYFHCFNAKHEEMIASAAYKVDPDKAVEKAVNDIEKSFQSSQARYWRLLKDTQHFIHTAMRMGINGTNPWGLPKGRSSKRRNSAEAGLETALREFVEETKIPLNWITVHSKEPFIIEYEDDDVTYVQHIYFASTEESVYGFVDPTNDDQMVEVTSIEWLSKEDLAAKTLDQVTKHLYLDNYDRLRKEFVRAINGYKPGDILMLGKTE